jgi:hypothetical protein
VNSPDKNAINAHIPKAPEKQTNWTFFLSTAFEHSSPHLIRGGYGARNEDQGPGSALDVEEDELLPRRFQKAIYSWVVSILCSLITSSLTHLKRKQ